MNEKQAEHKQISTNDLVEAQHLSFLKTKLLLALEYFESDPIAVKRNILIVIKDINERESTIINNL